MANTEGQALFEMCWVLYEDFSKGEPDPMDIIMSRQCKVLAAALHTAKSTLSSGSPRRVFIQDLSASLNRKEMLSNEQLPCFTQLGYDFMEKGL